MWTPKRIILLACGFLMFTLVYIVYSLTALGRINTLPPLPDQYKFRTSSAAAVETPPRQPVGPSPLEKKLEMAFNRNCEELKWPVLLELNSKSMVMAAGTFEIVEDGRVKLEPMSLALFGKKKNDGRGVEINTLKCKQAYIRFDRRVTSFSPNELSGRKIIEAELFGDSQKTPIRITNNRRTAIREDDLVVTINNGPLYYIEKTQIVKTSDSVHLMDGDKTVKNGQLIPPKADIYAQGMEMELATSTPPPPMGFLPPAKPKNQNISGVKRIVLKEAVTMNLYVSSGTPFPSNDKSIAAGNNAAAKQPAQIRIHTPGRFEYQVFKDNDIARFDVPPNAEQTSTSPQDVTVERINKQGDKIFNDMLVCKHLHLQLKRRNNEAPPAAGAAPPTDEQGLEIEMAHATGPDVTLTSDAEKLDAHGTDFTHDSAAKLTILKGVPYMEANKDDSLIQAPELRIQDIPLPAAAGDKGKNLPPKTYQQVQAAGPGSIHMTNKSSGKRSIHAYWNDRLLSTRDGALDLLVLTGSARFVDDEHEQSLKAETLKVWLLAEDKNPSAPAKAAAKPAASAKAAAIPAPSRRPHHIEALRNVLAHSREMNIHDAARLVVRFSDVPAARMPPPSSSGTPAPAHGGTPTVPGPLAAAPPPLAAKGAALSAPLPVLGGLTPPPAKTPAAEPARPIDLSAYSIEADVLRCEERMALDHLWAEGGPQDNIHKRGGVRVKQEPAKTGEEGVDIESNTLDMKCSAHGNLLVVTGDLARLKMDKILILGPEVNIDQAANKAWVEGGGVMEMQSDRTLENKPLAHPVPLTVHWSERMLFSGSFAWFDGGIQAEQGNARLACQRLQVMFDKPISLKEGMRGDQPAKVSKLVGDKDVRVEDQTFAQGQLQKYQLLSGKYIMMNTVPRDEEVPSPSPPVAGKGNKDGSKSNDANEVTLYGPGSVRILQRGGAEAIPTPGKPVPVQPAPAKAAHRIRR